MQEILAIPTGQRKILIELSCGNNTSLTSKEMLRKLNLSGSSVVEALQLLEQKDYIESRNKSYFMVDPIIKSTLNLHYGQIID